MVVCVGDTRPCPDCLFKVVTDAVDPCLRGTQSCSQFYILWCCDLNGDYLFRIY